ncbi:MAG: chemotaxis protein CheC [Opitutaceae bacterium]
MELTLEQKDGLTELINIGYGRAAGALSELTGYRISLEVPKVTLHDIGQIGPMLQEILVSPVASVNQIFSGPVSGSALLLLDENSALAMSRLLGDERFSSREFDANAKEIITEVGNIVLNACLGVFGNLLQVQVTFSVPRLSVDKVTRVLEIITAESAESLQYGLMIHTRFHVKTADVTGYMVIVLGITSLDRLMIELRNWETRQTQ